MNCTKCIYYTLCTLVYIAALSDHSRTTYTSMYWMARYQWPYFAFSSILDSITLASLVQFFIADFCFLALCLSDRSSSYWACASLTVSTCSCDCNGSVSKAYIVMPICVRVRYSCTCQVLKNNGVNFVGVHVHEARRIRMCWVVWYCYTSSVRYSM
jgi:hypothetical protein